MDRIDQEIDQISEIMEKSLKTDEPSEISVEMVKNTIRELGAEGLRKALPQLTESQQVLLKSILEDIKNEEATIEKATSMDEEIVPESGDQEKNEKKPKQAKEDEDLVKESNATVKNQGDDSVQSGQVIKSEEIEKGGEGSKGGKIIGHTKSGKPIYQDHKHPSHADFSVEDHNRATGAVGIEMTEKNHIHGYGKYPEHKELKQAWDWHQKQARAKKKAEGKTMEKSQFKAVVERMLEKGMDKDQCVNALAKSQGLDAEKVSAVWDALVKSGEGSRGGKVVGHTKSGKPIYMGAGNYGESHSDFGHLDHLDAADHHYKAREKAYKNRQKANDAGDNEKAEKHLSEFNAHTSAMAYHNASVNMVGRHPEDPAGEHVKTWSQAATQDGNAHAMKYGFKEKKAPAQNSEKQALVAKMQSGKKLTKEESDRMGPLTSRDLAPKTGDSFVEGLENKVKKSFEGDFVTEFNPFANRTIGQNCHYDVDAYIEKSAQEQSERLSKSSFDYDSEAGESLEKSEGEAKPLTPNDYLEKGLDMSSCQIQVAQANQTAQANGAFVVKSFADEEMEKLFQPQDMWAQEEAMEKSGEGSRGGKIIGHTKSGKPIYGESHEHPSYKNFTEQDHKEAQGLHNEKASILESRSKMERVMSGGIQGGDFGTDSKMSADKHRGIAMKHMMAREKFKKPEAEKTDPNDDGLSLDFLFKKSDEGKKD